MRYFTGACLLFAHQLLPLSVVLARSPDFHIDGAASKITMKAETTSRSVPSAAGYAMVCAPATRSQGQRYARPSRQLPEPRSSNPYLVRAFGKLFTQDMCNSVHEYSSTEALASLPPNTTTWKSALLRQLRILRSIGIKYWWSISHLRSTSRNLSFKTLPNRKIFIGLSRISM